MSNLKYDFIDDDHKRMHNALIAAGWSCENDEPPLHCSNNKWEWVYKKGKESIYFSNFHVRVLHRDINNLTLNFYETSFSKVADILEQEMRDKQPQDFSHIKVGQWVKSLVTEAINAIQQSKYYQRIVSDDMKNIFCFINDNGAIVCSISEHNWDLTDIRDTNPDEENNVTAINSIAVEIYPPIDITNPADFRIGQLKTDDQQEYYLITKDNIIEVLEYNQSLGLKIKDIEKTDDYICYRQFINGKWERVRWGFAFNWLDHIELDLGKLKPIPKPKFDFVQYLMDNGGVIRSDYSDYKVFNFKGNDLIVYLDRFTYGKYLGLKLTKENVDILIQMAKLAEELS